MLPLVNGGFSGLTEQMNHGLMEVVGSGEGGKSV